MAKRPVVIPGEATESDSEEEINHPTIDLTISQGKLRNPSAPRGIVVAGEAPESDEEEVNASIPTNTSVLSVVSDNNQKVPKKINKQKYELQHTSLLHRKLYERNVWLRKDITEFIHQTVGISGQKLNVTNQQLLRSQVQLQETVTALHSLHSNSTQLNNKLSATLSDSFIPEIRIRD